MAVDTLRSLEEISGVSASKQPLVHAPYSAVVAVHALVGTPAARDPTCGTDARICAKVTKPAKPLFPAKGAMGFREAARCVCFLLMIRRLRRPRNTSQIQQMQGLLDLQYRSRALLFRAVGLRVSPLALLVFRQFNAAPRLSDTFAEAVRQHSKHAMQALAKMPCARVRLFRVRPCCLRGSAGRAPQESWLQQPAPSFCAMLSIIWHRLVEPVSRLLLRVLRPVRAALHGRILVWPACKFWKKLQDSPHDHLGSQRATARGWRA